VDRLTVLAGAVVCWHFELLPRWALAALIAREIVTACIAQLGLRRGVDLEINWVGRIGVALVLAAIFWAQVVESVVWDVMLVAGVVFASLATLLYVRAGLTRVNPA
jgi:cardiolipin synthase